MNKKFLSAILFGALMVTSTGTFVSCKDYDDDIENLQAQINAQKSDLSTQVATLQTALSAAQAEAAAAKAAAATAKDAATAAEAAGKQAAAEAKAAAIEEALAAVESLKAEVAAGYVTAEAYQAKVNALTTQIAAVDDSLAKMGGQVDAAEKAIAALQTQMKALENYAADKKATAESIKAAETAIANIKTAIANIQEAMKTNASEADVKAVDDKVAAVADQVAKINANLVTLQGKALRSLVYVPYLYVDGIEATEYAFGLSSIKDVKAATGSFEYADNDANIRYSVVKGQTVSYSDSKKNWNVDPVWTVEYHLNPTTAKVETSQLSFASRDAEVIASRAAGDNASKTAPAVKASEINNGVLTVGYTANGLKLKELNAEAGVTAIMALEANIKNGEKDTIITSDYVQLYPSQVVPQYISFSKEKYGYAGGYPTCTENAKRAGYYHLAQTADDAIKNAAPLKVEYNGSLELKDYLEIHYNQSNELCAVNNTKTAGEHKVWAYGEEAQFNLEYRYSLVEFTIGDFLDSEFAQQTKENKYGYVNAQTGHFEPRYVDANGNSVASDGTTGVSSIGKKPVVRVEVVDKTTGAIILGGFVKIQIVRTIAPKFAPVFNMGKQAFACGWLTNFATWSQYSNLLLETAAVSSKAEFEQLYVLDKTYYGEKDPTNDPTYQGSNNEYYAITYVKDAKGNMIRVDEQKAYKNNNFYFGYIEEYGNTQGVANDRIQWITNQTIREAIYAQPNHKVTVYICYKPRPEVGEGSNANIFVPLTLEVVKPTATYGKKIDNYWYDDNNVRGKGDYQRLNVAYPQDGGNTKNFVVDFDNAFDGNTIKFTITNNEVIDQATGEKLFDQSWAKKDYIKYAYYFDKENNGKKIKGASGTTYELKVKSEGGHSNKLYTTAGALIATIDQTSQTQLGEITFATSNAAKDLLNKFAYSVANKDAFFAKIGIVAYNDCDIVLDKWFFNARFVRPVNADYKKVGKFTDAEDNGSKVDILDLFDWSDWRGNVKFINGTDYTNTWLFAYYGVQAVKVNLPAMETNLSVEGNTDWKKMKNVTSQVVFTHIDANGNVISDINAAAAVKFDLSAYNQKPGDVNVYKAIKKAMGQIKYENNGNNVASFKVRVPVEVTYDWGTLVDTIEFTVENTMGI